MDAFQQMSSNERKLTPTEHLIFEAITADPESFVQSTTTMAAQYAGVSQSAISRFCQKIGYDTFSEFRMDLMLSLSTHTPTQTASQEKNPIEYLCNMVRATDISVKKEVFRNLTKRIIRSGKVITTGGGLSAPPALMLSMELLKYKIPCYFAQNGQDMIYMHVVNPDDLIIIFSSKNDTQRLLINIIQDLPKNRRPYVVLVSHSATHPLKKYADDFILLPTWQTERYPVYIEPMTSMLAFCSIVMLSISKLSKKDPEPLPPIISGMF